MCLLKVISPENENNDDNSSSSSNNDDDNDAVVCSVEYSEPGSGSAISGSNVVTDELKGSARSALMVL
jgi:hypothetical protein